MHQIESQENISTIQKLRELVNEKDETIQNMSKEIEKITKSH